MRACVAVCRAYGIPPHRVRGHFEYSPTRKIDPSGPSRWAASGKWEMDEFRDDVAAGLAPIAPPPPPPTIPTGDIADMEAIFAPTFDPSKPGVKWWNNATPHLAIWQTGAVTRATNAHYELAEHKGAPVILLDSQDQYNDLVSKIAG